MWRIQILNLEWQRLLICAVRSYLWPFYLEPCQSGCRFHSFQRHRCKWRQKLVTTSERRADLSEWALQYVPAEKKTKYSFLCCVSAVLFAVASSLNIHDNSVKDDCSLVFLFFAKLKCICKKKINNTTWLFQEQKQSVWTQGDFEGTWKAFETCFTFYAID